MIIISNVFIFFTYWFQHYSHMIIGKHELKEN